MRPLVEAVDYLNLAAYSLLAAAAIRVWTVRRGRAAFWAALAFATLAVVVLAARVLPDEPASLAERSAERIDIVLLLLFPYFLYRFTTAFDPPALRADVALSSITTAIAVWTFALPEIPQAGERRPAWFVAWLTAFLIHWTVLSVISAWRLWRAGRGQPSVARRRMWLLAAAAGAITLAIFAAAANADPDSELDAAAGLLAFVSALAFLLGLAPPRILRIAWRVPEQRRVRQATEDLVALARTQEEVADRVAAPIAALVGAGAVSIRNAQGELVGSYDRSDHDGPADRTERIEIATPGATLEVWTTPYAPFFGDEELDVLRSLAALTGLALDRVRLFQQEHRARLALEQADELKTNFVALAAHELRTPVTAIHGVVQTLSRRGDLLEREVRDELTRALEEQTARMARLVEQLLDLSRLDAEAIEISPRTLRVRDRLEEIVEGAAAGRTPEVAIDVPAALEATVDVHAFERILSNLVTNALRYGAPPVLVSAQRSDRHLRVVVEDRGAGVPPDFVPSLFERFSRSERAREKTLGTGLGLAIARAYARAHGGDLLYEPAEPHGARFQLVLPAERRSADG